jgi:hypothetical protein
MGFVSSGFLVLSAPCLVVAFSLCPTGAGTAARAGLTLAGTAAAGAALVAAGVSGAGAGKPRHSSM